MEEGQVNTLLDSLFPQNTCTYREGEEEEDHIFNGYSTNIAKGRERGRERGRGRGREREEGEG